MIRRFKLLILVLLLSLVMAAKSLHSETNHKSLWKAIGLSLILPGGGELYLGNKTDAVPFIAVEVASWLAYFGFRTYGNALTDEYKIFAHRYIGIDPSMTNEDIWYVIEMYYNRDVYIERLLREARQLYPDNPTAQRRYVETHAVSLNWSWPDKATWFQYQDKRKAARTAYERARVMFGVMLLNRMASAAKILFIRKAEDKGVSFDFRVLPDGKAVFTIGKSF